MSVLHYADSKIAHFRIALLFNLVQRLFIEEYEIVAMAISNEIDILYNNVFVLFLFCFYKTVVQ